MLHTMRCTHGSNNEILSEWDPGCEVTSHFKGTYATQSTLFASTCINFNATNTHIAKTMTHIILHVTQLVRKINNLY